MVSEIVDDVVAKDFEEFFADRFVSLSRLAFLLTGSASAADEIAQDALEGVSRLWATIEQPRAYARVAVVNGARSWIRHRQVAERSRADVAPPNELDADAIAVRRVLAALPEREREVVVLRYYADLKVDDIAAELDLPVGTVKSLLHRTLAKLNKELS
ncbi:MAG TPA: sigma-70 family RNA polymerase sigma factor [Ilumatobacter sp.]|nr:sigma-70 family RNA polymerase sigma factor [Ilumatobacter sp.]